MPLDDLKILSFHQHGFVAVGNCGVMPLNLKNTEFQFDFVADLDAVRVTINDLRRQFPFALSSSIVICEVFF